VPVVGPARHASEDRFLQEQRALEKALEESEVMGAGGKDKDAWELERALRESLALSLAQSSQAWGDEGITIALARSLAEAEPHPSFLMSDDEELMSSSVGALFGLGGGAQPLSRSHSPTEVISASVAALFWSQGEAEETAPAVDGRVAVSTVMDEEAFEAAWVEWDSGGRVGPEPQLEPLWEPSPAFVSGWAAAAAAPRRAEPVVSGDSVFGLRGISAAAQSWTDTTDTTRAPVPKPSALRPQVRSSAGDFVDGIFQATSGRPASEEEEPTGYRGVLAPSQRRRN
jgi:hypothetical protein